MTKTQTTGTKATTTRRCECGCNEATSSSRTMYKPGHDARHASQVAKRIAATTDVAERNALLETLPTQHLQAKALAQATRAEHKAQAKAQKAGAKAKTPKTPTDLVKATPEIVAEEQAQYEADLAEQVALRQADIEAQLAAEEVPQLKLSEPLLGTVKIGRWEYPSRTYVTGEKQRNSKRDGSGDWISY